MSVSNAFEIEEKVVKVHGKLRENMGMKSVSDVVTPPLKERRRKLLNEVFGIDAKRVKSFSENDRGEDRC
jgi:predicted CopG family antitoxin